jgi:hypothetical protein
MKLDTAISVLGGQASAYDRCAKDHDGTYPDGAYAYRRWAEDCREAVRVLKLAQAFGVFFDDEAAR